MRVGSKRICATSTSSANPSIHRQLRRCCFCAPTAARSSSTSLRRAAARSSTGNVTKSPRRATSSLLLRRLRRARIVKNPSRRTTTTNERNEERRLEQLVAEGRLERRSGAGVRCRVAERDGRRTGDRDVDVDVDVGPRRRAVAQEVLVAQLEAELVVDLREPFGRACLRVGATRLVGDRLEIVRREVRGLDPDREDPDSLGLQLLERRIEAGPAADVVAVREQDDARRTERGAAHLGHGRGEGVVDARAFGQLGRLREHGCDLGPVGRQAGARRSASG